MSSRASGDPERAERVSSRASADPERAKRDEGFLIASRDLHLLALFSHQVSPAASQKRRADSDEPPPSGEFGGALTADRGADRSSLAAARSPLGSPEPLTAVGSNGSRGQTP